MGEKKKPPFDAKLEKLAHDAGTPKPLAEIRERTFIHDREVARGVVMADAVQDSVSGLYEKAHDAGHIPADATLTIGIFPAMTGGVTRGVRIATTVRAWKAVAL